MLTCTCRQSCLCCHLPITPIVRFGKITLLFYAEVLFVSVMFCCIGGEIQQNAVVYGVGSAVCTIWRCSGT